MLVNEAKQYHIACSAGQIGGYCILPGDPGRCESIASQLDRPRFIAQNREFVTYSGYLDDVPVSVCSTGIGGPSAAIAVEELVACGAHTFLRVGTCGGIDMSVKAGDYVIATGAVRQEGTSLHYAPPEYPAVSDFAVTDAVRRAAEAVALTCHIGVVQSKDSFYGQHSPERSPVSRELADKWNAWRALGVLASEMECAALFVCARSLGARAGALLLAVWNQCRADAGIEDPSCHDISQGITLAMNALRLLIKSDKATPVA